MVQTNKLAINSSATISQKASSIYDPSNPSLIIATATDAAYTDIAYTSFETSISTNNWSYNTSLISTDDKYTGSSCLKFDQIVRSVSRQSLNAGIKYKVTFWVKNLTGNSYFPLVNKNNDMSGGAFSNNITPTLVYTNPVTGWALYGCDIPTGTNSVYIHNQDASNTANGLPIMIDEVRLYPEGSAMSTTTYNLQGLKTSVTDANNKTQYMEYDGLGRLRLIRDEQRNILKTYEYNYKN